jgi:hypothetical protein
MSLEHFDAHLHDPAPGFRCYACGDRSKKATFLARVKNRIGNPGSGKAIAIVNKLCGLASIGVKDLVELHDGVLLYQDNKSDAAGVEFFKAAEWEARTNEMRESMIAMGYDEADMPDWFHHGVVFGEIPRSANYFVIQPDGDEAGQIFYCDHDDFQTKAMASSLEDLLNMIVEDPAGFLYQCGCFTRYSDGKTDIQWIPKEYVPDCNGPSKG